MTRALAILAILATSLGFGHSTVGADRFEVRSVAQAVRCELLSYEHGDLRSAAYVTQSVMKVVTGSTWSPLPIPFYGPVSDAYPIRYSDEIIARVKPLPDRVLDPEQAKLEKLLSDLRLARVGTDPRGCV